MMTKKILLLLCLYALLGTSMAQDIYTSGYFMNSNGQKAAAVFKNDEIYLSREETGRDLTSPSMTIDTLTDDIYWACNSYPVNMTSNGFGNVMKNDEVLLNNVFGTGINAIALDGNDLYSAGYTNDYYESVATIWKNGETAPLFTFNTGSRSEVLGIVAVDGIVYSCGYYVDGLIYGCVWVNGDLYACYPNNKVVSITYENGDIYYIVENFQVTVYVSGHDYFTLGTNSSYSILTYDIEVANGDTYIVGFMGFNDLCVWKNAELLYIHPFSREADLRACQLFGESLYYVGWDDEDHGIVYKDGEQIGSTKFQYYYDVFVRPSTVAVDEVQTENLTLSPIPAKESITIEGIAHGDIINIFSTTGQLVKTVAANANNKIDVSNLPAGLYLVQCGNQVLRFVKE